MSKVRAAVEEVFGNISPNEGVTAARLSDLVLSVRKHVEGSTEQERYATRWLPYVLPPREEEEAVLIESGVITPPPSSPGLSSGEVPQPGTSAFVDTSTGPLRQLLDETADLIDSPTFTRIHTLILGAMFSHLIDDRVVGQAFPSQPTHSPSSSISSAQHPRIQELDSAVTVVPGEPRVKLANLLAIITRQAHAIGNGNNPPNEYVSVAEKEVKELEAFAAVIYASNLDETIKESQPQTTDNAVQSSGGVAVSDVGTESVDEIIESKLESAWMKVSGSTFSSR
jgi:peroxin-3